MDTATAELKDCGQIGGFGAEILGMFIPICEHSQLELVEAQDPTCTKAGDTILPLRGMWKELL